ncbi:hypothetical protein XH99_29520 [Bradyrhizobium nanningense]|uniref:Uncharacterized protein n=1 Tax=Bradyrhizobium nanningense TaxID=1325118 RepID=A0A4Q0RWL5_9BRAD|nr:hypothetical protein [Bradyrhizobium nanningense]RXH24203.1 hypothetical protein XH99_29520 [Bradyrhizobium nanningense]RXH29241.1 hypothetical protein XH84_22265 [Bradyrhizobium nanningense]
MQDWKMQASKARLLLSSSRYGDRENALAKVAAGKDVNTLRRAIFALNFLEGFVESHPNWAPTLNRAPLSVVEIFARWYSFDVEGTIRAMKEFAGGKHTVRSLTAAMSEAREQMIGEKRSESLEASYRSRIERVAQRAVSRLFAEPISTSGVRVKNANDPPVDFHYYRMVEDGRPPKTVVALIVGPYQNRKLYRKRRFDWCFRALALAWIYDDVVLILPDAREVQTYRDWIASVRLRSETRTGSDRRRTALKRLPEVHVIHPGEGADSPSRTKAKARMSRKDEAVV